MFRLEERMSLKKDIRSVTYLKSRAADLLNQINATQRPVIITQNGEARAVIQDPISYERWKTALGLMKLLAIGETDVRNGRVVEQNKVFEKLQKKLVASSDPDA